MIQKKAITFKINLFLWFREKNNLQFYKEKVYKSNEILLLK